MPSFKKFTIGTQVGFLKIKDLGVKKDGNQFWVCECSCGQTINRTSGQLNEALKKERKSHCGCKSKNRRKNLKLSDFPKLVEELNIQLNVGLKPEKISFGSSKVLWWNCEAGHTFEMSVWERTRNDKPAGCSYCSGKKVWPGESLADIHPSIAAEWHPEKNLGLTPSEVLPRSNREVIWFCPNSVLHDYPQRISDRTRGYYSDNPTIKNAGCPFCSGAKVAPDTSLAFKFPEIASEWHPTKNKDLKPDQVTCGSNLEVWWVCEKKHEYKKAIVQRTSRNVGCTECPKYSSSQEIRILTEIMSIFDLVRSRDIVSGFEIDVLIPEYMIGIEYDSYYYHKQRLEQDLKKGEWCENNDIKLFRMREPGLPAQGKWQINSNAKDLTKSDLNRLIKIIQPNVNQWHRAKCEEYVQEKSFVNEVLYKKYLSYFPSPFPEKALQNTHPHLVQFWDYRKNFPLTPRNFTYGSKHSAWWICENGHSEEKSIYRRVKGGCGICDGKKVDISNCLSTMKPELALEWNYEKNKQLKPETIYFRSGSEVWWQCLNNKEHIWKASVETRYNGFRNCEVCFPTSNKKKAVSYKGKDYQSIADASRQTGIARKTIRNSITTGKAVKGSTFTIG